MDDNQALLFVCADDNIKLTPSRGPSGTTTTKRRTKNLPCSRCVAFSLILDVKEVIPRHIFTEKLTNKQNRVGSSRFRFFRSPHRDLDPVGVPNDRNHAQNIHREQKVDERRKKPRELRLSCFQG